jgi:soluble lytic murein transglycosylase-like protein
MKRLLIALLLLAGPAHALEINLDTIRAIESGGNPRAYNKGSGARGLYQITDICRRDYNQMTGAKVQPDDLWEPETNRRIANWYLHTRIPQLLRHYGKPVTVETVLTAYNAGIRYVGRELPRETVNYIAKYERGNR